MAILDELRAAMERSTKTRYAVAQTSGVNEGNLSRFVAGGGLSVANAERVAAALGYRITLARASKRKGA